MNLRDLRYLLALVETRHFGNAAKQCHVSQPTLSGQIQKLEDELGVALFERSNRHVSVTDVGTQVARLARQILTKESEIRELARQNGCRVEHVFYTEQGIREGAKLWRLRRFVRALTPRRWLWFMCVTLTKA